MSHRRILFLLPLLAFASSPPLTAQTAPAPTPPAFKYQRPDFKTRRDRYIDRMFGWQSIAKSVVSAGISTARNKPREWGPHWDGFGKRFASGMGQKIIGNTVQFGLDEATKLDPHYYRSPSPKFGSKLKNALLNAVTERNRNGIRVAAIPRFVGIYTANILARETWYPRRYSWKDGVRSGTVSIGMGAVFNLFKEFIP